MSVLDILMDSVEYPFKDWQKFISLSIILVIIYFFSTTTLFNQYSIIFAIISVILEIIIFGYFSGIITATFRGYNTVPPLNFVENIVDGFKYLILGLVYSIIPLIILFYLFSAAGNNNPLWVIVNLLTPNTTILGIATGEFIETFIQALITSKYIITYTIIFLLGIVFSYPFFISLGRILDSGKIQEGFKIKKLYNAYKEIGIESYTKWFILILIYLIVFSGLWALLSLIPFGDYIGYFIIAPYIILFLSRATGLIYKQNTKYPDYQAPNNTNILQEEELRKKALEQSAKRYSEEIDRVNQLRKKNYEEKQEQYKQRKLQKEKEKQEKELKEKIESFKSKPEPTTEEKIESFPNNTTSSQEPTTERKIESFANNTTSSQEPTTKEKIENFKPVTEIKPIHVEKTEEDKEQ